MPRSFGAAILAEATNTDVVLNGHNQFVQQLEQWTASLATDHLAGAVDLNVGIAKIAREHNLNDHQIDRLVQRVNTEVFQHRYAGTKGAHIRRVEFPIAKTAAVKQLLGQTADIEVAAEAAVDGAISKTASLQGSSYDSLFHSQDETPALYDDEQLVARRRDLIAKKAIQAYNNLQKEAAVTRQQLLSQVMQMGASLVEYAKRGHDSQAILAKVAAAAELGLLEQGLVCQFANTRAQVLKRNGQLPSNLPFVLTPVVDQPYQLQKHAFYRPQPLPTVITGVVAIDGYADLEKMANQLKETFAKAKKSAADGADSNVSRTVKAVGERKRQRATAPESNEMDLEDENSPGDAERLNGQSGM